MTQVCSAVCKDEGVCAIFNGRKICVKRGLEGKKEENNPWIGIEMGVEEKGPATKPTSGCGKTPCPPPQTPLLLVGSPDSSCVSLRFISTS